MKEDTMGLDMYLKARKHISESIWSEPAAAPEPADVAMVDQLGASLRDAVGMTATIIPMPRGTQTPNPMFTQTLEAAGLTDAPRAPIYGVHVEIIVGYWRKANAVHAWFVNNVQGGNDDCKDYYVEDEQLTALRDACNRILATVKVNEEDKANPILEEIAADLVEELLPPQGGFFFGSTDVDAWYVEDLRETVKQIDAILASPVLQSCDLYYQSSW